MRAFVTGGSRGIGRAICVAIAQDALARGETPRIVVSATGKSEDLRAVENELAAMGAEALAVAGDLADPETPERIMREALAFCDGRLNAFVHNAGYPVRASLRDVSLTEWDAMFAVNVRAFLSLARTAHDALRESKGAIVAIGSSAAVAVAPDRSGYSSSKAALLMLVRQMAFDWGPDGIRANCVSPGITHSRSTEAAFANEDIVASRAARLPLRRIGQPEDVAAAVSFLIGPGAGYITGENINVDGGLLQTTMSMLSGGKKKQA